MVKAIGDYLLANVDEISQLLSLEAGKPLWEAVMEIEGAARYFEYYGNQAETLEVAPFRLATAITISPRMSRVVFRARLFPGTIPWK